MKSICKFTLIACLGLLSIRLLFVFFTDPTSPGEDDAINQLLYNESIFMGVAAIQIEQAMAERRIPPLRPILNKFPDEPLMPMKRILIVSTWRSGSSFLGELIHSAPGVFYSYEPLYFFGDNPSPGSSAQMDLIRSLFQCQFSREYLTMSTDFFLIRNRRLWDSCRKNRSLCQRPDFVARLCSHLPVQLIKVVRLRIAQLIERPIPKDWKIVYLARDPRGIVASRANLTWCQEDIKGCADTGTMCRDVDQDVQLVKELQAKQPDKFYLLRFEDLSQDVQSETMKLFRFLGLPFSSTVQVFLTTHTKQEAAKDDPFSTRRDSSKVAKEWKTKLTKKKIDQVSDLCESLIKTLNYDI